MKPGTKAEGRFKMFRHDWSKNASKNGITKYFKKMMNKARRRESDKIIKDEKDNACE